jgi:thiamine biosynthesis lipoprotein
VDRVLAMLAERFALDDALVEVGGELRGQGVKPDGQPWWVALERAPRWRGDALEEDATQPLTRIALHGLAVATSGDYRRFFRHDGLLCPHTLDPRSGRPLANGVALVTVLHAQCMAADALSTALGVMGEAAAMEWADARDIAALIVSRRSDGALHERMTRALMQLM